MAKAIDFIVLANTGTSAAPSYKPIAAQRGATLNINTETLDISSKDSGGWKEAVAGQTSWSIEADGLLTEDDLAYKKLEDAIMERETVKVQLQTKAGNKYEGMAVITSSSLEAPYDDVATYSLSFEGASKLTKIPGSGS